jgi:hypothetical protein
MSDWLIPQIYPNPCLQGETVKILSNSKAYEVFNTAGALIMSLDGTTINTTSLSPGVYYIKFLDTSYTSPLVIQ